MRAGFIPRPGNAGQAAEDIPSANLVSAGNAPEPHTKGVGFSLIFPAFYPFQAEGIVGISCGVLGK